MAGAVVCHSVALLCESGYAMCWSLAIGWRVVTLAKGPMVQWSPMVTWPAISEKGRTTLSRPIFAP